MSVDDMSLHLDITGDATSGIAAAEGFNKSLGVSDEAVAGLEKMLGELTAELGITVEALNKSSAGHVRATEAANAHTGALVKEEGQLGVVARAMNAVGLEAGGMAARVEAASGAFTKMGDTIPVILAIGTALEAAFASIKFVEHGIDVAKSFEANMETLRASVEAQGGSWDKASASIQKFLDVESKASGFTQNQLLESLNRLITAGASVADSMKIVSVAEEEAVARHSDVLSVVNLLIEAESGRAQGLVKLDPRLRQIIKSHGDLADILKALHELNKQQLADDDSLERADARRQAAFDAAARSLGEKLLPYLTDLDYMLIGALKNAEEFGQGFATVISGVTDGFVQAVRAASDLGSAMNALLHGNPAMAGSFYADAQSAMRTASLDNQKAQSGFSDIINFGHEDPFSYGRNAANQAVQKHNDSLGNIGSMDFNPTLGSGIKSARSGAGSHSHQAKNTGADYSFTDMADGAKAAKSAIDPLDELLKHLPKTVAGYTLAIKDLDDRLVFENSMNKELTGLLADAKTKYEDLRASYNAYGESLGKHPTKAEKEHLHDLKLAADDAKHSYDDLKTSVDANAASMQKHTDEVATDTAALTHLQEAQYQKITAAIGTLADKGVKLFDSLFNRGKQGAQSFGQVFKSMIDDIVSYLEKSALQSLLMKIFHVGEIGPDGKAASSGAGGLWGAIQTVFGLTSNSSPAGGLDPNIANDPAFGFGGIANPTIAAGGIGADGTLAFGNGQYAVPNIAGGILNSSNPFSGLGMLTKNSNSFLGNLAQNGWGAKFGGPGGTATAGSYGLAAIGGAAVGQLVFQGRGYADMGGSIGGMAGLYLGGPIGAVIGAIVGSAAGSLFGNHFNPADEPDINKTQEWGQWLADLQGKTSGNPMNANGQQFVMDGQTQTATKSKGWNIVMEDFVAKFRGKEKDLPASLQGVFSGIASLWGGAQGQADFNNNGKDGNLQLGAGTMANYTQFWSYITGYGQQIADLMSNYSPTQTYAASMQGAVSGIGSYTPDGTPMILHDFPDSGGPGAHSAPPPGGGGVGAPPGPGLPYQPPGGGYNPRGGGGAAPQTVVNQYVNVQGTIIGQNQLAQASNSAVGQAVKTGRAFAMMR